LINLPRFLSDWFSMFSLQWATADHAKTLLSTWAVLATKVSMEGSIKIHWALIKSSCKQSVIGQTA
jgi:hypothetical protein